MENDPAGADLFGRATAAYTGGDAQLGLQLLEDAIAALPAADGARRFYLLIQQAGWLRECGYPDQATAARDAAAAELEPLPREGHETEWSGLRMEQGIAARRGGQLTAAEDFLNEAADLAEQSLAKDLLRPDVRANQASLYLDQGRLGDAQDALNAALEIDRRTGNVRNQSNDLNMLGLVHGQLGDPLTAKVYFTNAFEIAYENGLVREATEAMTNLAALMDDAGDHAGAEELFRGLGDLLGAGGDLASEACSVANQGAAAANAGETDRAVSLFTRSYELHLASGNQLHGIHDLLNLSSTERRREQPRQAMVHAETALAAAREYGFVELLWAAEYAVASARMALLGEAADGVDTGQAEQALAGFGRAVDAIELLRGRVDRPEEREALLTGKEAVYDDAVALCLGLGRAHAAFAFCERARMRSFLEALGADRLDRLETGPGDAAAPDVARRDELVRRLLDPATPAGDKPTLLAELRTVRAELIAARPALAAISQAELPSMDEICAALPAETALLEFFQLGNSVIMFLLDATGLKDAGAVTFDEPLPLLVQRFRDEIEAGSLDLPTGNQLFMALFRPVLPLLPTTANLIVVPHKSLHYVPFSALWFVPAGDDAPPRQYLKTRFYLTVAPSASYLPFLAKVAARQRELTSAVVLGDPTGDLEGAAAEAVMVAGRLRVPAVIGPAATRAALLTAGSPRVLHVACHGTYDDGDPLLSGLQLADGVVTVEDLIEAGPAPALLVLSGCVTGLAKGRPGDELIGLAQGALRRGTRAVIATLWETFDESSAIFFDQFYAALMEGESVSASVGWARQALATGPGGFDQPVDWAPFVLIGDPELCVVAADETPKARMSQGLLLLEQGDPKAAKVLFREVAETGSEAAALAQYSLGELLEREGVADEAAAFYRRAADSGSPHWAGLALLNLGVMLLHADDETGARTQFEAAMAGSDTSAAARAATNLGNLLTAEGDVEAAKAAYQHAIDTGDPGVAPVAALWLGSLLVQSGDELGAWEPLRLAADSLQPQVTQVASFNLAVLLAKHGEIAEARLRFAEAQHGEDADLVSQSAAALVSLSRYG